MNNLICLGGIGHAVQQQCGQFLSKRDFIHVKGSEQGCDLLDSWVVVKSHDFHIPGDMYFPAFQGGHQVQRNGIVGSDKAVS